MRQSFIFMNKIATSFRPQVSWANAIGKWPDIIFSTRVRLARNISGYAFPQRAAPGALRAIREAAFEAVKASKLFNRGHFYKTSALSPLEKNFLIERHHISHNLASKERSGGSVINNDENLSAMINEEDHFRLQSMVSGFAIEAAFEAVNKLDDELAARLPYACSPKFGFLTACPTNVGTGMRVSCLVHLPALSRTGQMPALLESLSHLSMTARGIYGEGTYVLGDFYQISNATCLGHTEAQFCQNLDNTVRNLITMEVKAREKLVSPALKLKTEDGIFRAYGLLKHARALSYEEFMQNISLVRMGAAMGYPIRPDFAGLNQLTLLSQPAHLQAMAGKVLDPSERDEFRADYIRKNLN